MKGVKGTLDVPTLDRYRDVDVAGRHSTVVAEFKTRSTLRPPQSVQIQVHSALRTHYDLYVRVCGTYRNFLQLH